MDAQKIIEKAKEIINGNSGGGHGKLAEAAEFLRTYAGEKSSFYKHLSARSESRNEAYLGELADQHLYSFISYVQKGLLEGVSLERQAQIDVVSDFLAQAADFLDSNKVHAAAPAVIIGAALEEFLRTWVENAQLSLGNKKPSIDAYMTTLKEADLISKQDVKDITAWAGIRNSAAHGDWEEVKDRQRIRLMLEGVNLFMRKYTV